MGFQLGKLVNGLTTLTTKKKKKVCNKIRPEN
jgi:hypothetical protein